MSAEEIAEVRERLAAAAHAKGGRMQLRPTDTVMIGRVLDHVGDVDMTVDALLLEPRPQWVKTLIGGDLLAVYPAGVR